MKRNIPPQKIEWNSSVQESSLFENSLHAPSSNPDGSSTITNITRVSPDFIELGRWAACHRDERRWPLLYRTLWRLTHGEPQLLKISVDPDIYELEKMSKAVHRDAHKMKAFVRFKKIEKERIDQYVAWYEPDHHTLQLTCDFFARRFNGMIWTIFTPDDSAHWNGETLVMGAGIPKKDFKDEDSLEELWKTYYASTFNPARIKIRAMTKEMPVRFWKDLPEAQLISQLIEQSPSRLQKMYEDQPVSAASFLPTNLDSNFEDHEGPENLEKLKAAVQKCRGCGICEHATQAVFGEGPAHAEIMVVGEQPGDEEDLEGRPFIGPAGRLFDRALKDLGVNRKSFYVTNAVKHFKWKPMGKRRLHQRPSSPEVAACKPWLVEEVKNIRPKVLLCLGATAAQSVMGKSVTLGEVRGKKIRTGMCSETYVTLHPSAILRMAPELQEKEYTQWLRELALALKLDATSTQNLTTPFDQL